MPNAPGTGTGFVSVGDYLDANQDTLANEAGQIYSGVGGQIDAAHTSADQAARQYNPNEDPNGDYTTSPGYRDALDKAIAAGDQATALKDTGGLSDYFKTQLHDNQSQADFDANLLGGSGKLDAAGLSERASGLTGYLDQKMGAATGPQIVPGRHGNPLAQPPSDVAPPPPWETQPPPPPPTPWQPGDPVFGLSRRKDY